MEVRELVEMFFTLVLTPVLIYIAKYVVDYLKSKTENERVKETLTLVEEAVRTAVAETNQTFVDQLKADGKFTPQEMFTAFERSLDRTKEILGGEAEKLLKKSMIDINSYIRARIELEVSEQNTYTN